MLVFAVLDCGVCVVPKHAKRGICGGLEECTTCQHGQGFGGGRVGQGEISAVRGCEDELGQEAGVGGVAVEETGAEGEACWDNLKKNNISLSLLLLLLMMLLFW